MPISLGAARDRIRTIKVEFDGESANVSYWPNRMTPALEDDIGEASTAREVAAQLSQLIKRWELVDEDGEEIPADADTMAQVPSNLMYAIFEQIRKAENAEDEGKA